MCPHDVYDWWVEKYGRNLQAFWPVVDTEIGRLGIMMANEGSYPENARALALNGAEVVYRASYPASRHRQRDLRDPEPGPRARQQHVRRRAQHGHLLPLPRGDHAHRHLRRALVRHRLQGPHRRAPGLRGGVDLRGRGHRHRGPARPPGARPVGQLDEGPAHRALPAPLREAHLPQEPLSQARADEAQGVPREGHPAPDPPHARPRHLGQAAHGSDHRRSATHVQHESDRPAAQRGPRHGPPLPAHLRHRGVRDRRRVGDGLAGPDALHGGRLRAVRAGLAARRPAGRSLGPARDDGRLLPRPGRRGLLVASASGRVAARGRADADGRLRVDLPPGRHPDDRAERQARASPSASTASPATSASRSPRC